MPRTERHIPESLQFYLDPDVIKVIVEVFKSLNPQWSRLTTCGALTLSSTVSLNFYFFNLYLLLQFSDVLVKFNTVQPSSQPSLRTPRVSLEFGDCLVKPVSHLHLFGKQNNTCRNLQEPAGTWGLLCKSLHAGCTLSFISTLFKTILGNRVSLRYFCSLKFVIFFFFNLSPLRSWDDRQTCTSPCLVKSFILWSDAVLFHTGNLDRISNSHSAFGLVETGLTPPPVDLHLSLGAGL